MSGEVKLVGRWRYELSGPDGVIKDVRQGTNVVCTNGKEFLASFLYSAAVAASTFTCKYIAIGTDSTAEAAGQTALFTEVSRHTGTVSYVSNQIYQVTATFATGSGTGRLSSTGFYRATRRGRSSLGTPRA